MTGNRTVIVKAALILLCLLFVFSNSCGTSVNEPGQGAGVGFSAEQLRSDFGQMRSALENNHPDRLRYESAQTLAGLFDAAYHSLRDDMTAGEFYRLVAPLVARYHCGHTAIHPAGSFSPRMVLPLGIYLADGKAHVDADYGSMSGIQPGCEVLAIDGRPISAIVERMLAGICADALNTSAKIQRLNRYFFLYYNYFWGEADCFDLRVKGPAGQAESLVRVNARDFALVNGEVAGRFAASSRLLLELTGNRAVLTVPSFVISQNTDYRTFFENAFRQMNDQGVTRLIIDIRGNSGGDPEMAAALIAHLATAPFVYFKKGLSYPDLFAATAPHAVHFSGTVQVLIDGGCFSTSGHFCALVRHLGLAAFVGETGGGTFRCHDNSREFILNHTRMRLRVAQTTFEAAVPDQDVSLGFPPDFRVVPTISDILSGADAQMDFALSLGEG
jgi:hypothetical protein